MTTTAEQQDIKDQDILLGAIILTSRVRNGILPSQVVLELLKQLANILDPQEITDALSKRIAQDFQRKTGRPAGWR